MRGRRLSSLICFFWGWCVGHSISLLFMYQVLHVCTHILNFEKLSLWSQQMCHQQYLYFNAFSRATELVQMLSGMQVTQRLLLSTSSNSSYISLWRRRASAMRLWRHCEPGKQLFLLQHQTVHNHRCLPFQWLREAKGNHPNHGGGPQHLDVCPNENHLFAQ